ncbi:unnamed protein product [Cylicocyclus nassatus]|uniref:Uncharacterized protein n=1 Tax=Cylicocyclus nassatus TaxID=53992 RepID=A0AA36H801_CYLNA|nr:unnamed protein product [Cylicocyclus nassatus]
MISKKKKKYKGTGGGVYNLLKSPSYLHPLVEDLAEKHHIFGVLGLDEESDGELEYKSDDALAPNGLGIRYRVLPDCEGCIGCGHWSRSTHQVSGQSHFKNAIGEEEEVVLDNSPETFEEGRKKPATTDLALSKPKSIAARYSICKQLTF